ncbi:hypothetical protein A3H75_03040 [Candidatus Uhrbacteria bacterium RIFCSPLOWO2_02_FULL_51_9]|uniref:Baseplate protein J-like domain-containing protein n=1 Tax=Candidatus Uhrbacteria bacterium RIFCSPLOWO2_02_FULL_51_9 TaxID=1802410 RepID=A0A1F7VG91_9BACT|nr:MAG: hypothetical protein A3H75_03040 [Candidatus Uhrbacteria bacterium RIFCSPLOWO2_02_FULL_51_9]
MPPKKRVIPEPVAVKLPSIALYRNIAVTFLVLTILLLLTVVYLSVKKVTIRVTTEPMTIQASAQARVGEQAEDMPQVTGATAKFDVTLTREFKPTGTETKEAAAAGRVVIKNTTTRNQPLVATTRLLSPGGVLFRLKESVTVPAGGEVTARVYADKSGKQGELGPTKFTIPGLFEPLQQKIYAESSEPMTGGVLAIGIVSKEDIEKAKSAVRTAILEEAQRLLIAREKADTAIVGFVGKIAKVDFEVSGAAEDAVSGFSVTGKGVVVGALYHKEEARALVNRKLQEKVARQPVKLVTGEALPEVVVDRYDPNGLWVQLTLSQSGVTYVTENSPAFDPVKFYGKSRAEIEEYVRGISGVREVTVKFRPAWSDVAPRVPEHIEVRVVSE